MDILHHDHGNRRDCQRHLYGCGSPNHSTNQLTEYDPTTVPFRFRGLDTIGTIFFLLNIALFLLNILMISLRFYTFPETFEASYMHPSERLFIPSAVVSFGTILINISQYGLPNAGQWLDRAVIVLFWIDAALAIVASSGIYLLM